ncbi:MAG: hypothetical protein ACJ74P_06630 [Gaiellaceae bacterium]
MKPTTKMLKVAVVCGAAVVVATALARTAPAAGKVATCTPGTKKIGGAPARTFCGPAKAAVKLNGKTISYKGGSCSTSIGLFSVNIGTVVLGTVESAPDYFGVTAKAKAGSQSRQTIAVVHAGASHGVIGTVTLKPGLRGGTFSGKAFGSKATISGSFTC